MKTSILTLILFFSYLPFVPAQKKYMVKVTTLDNKVYKGLMFQVNEEGVFILPNNVHWDLKNPRNNIVKSRFSKFGLIKQIQIRKQGSIGIGMIAGLLASIGLTAVIVKAPGTNLGGAIGSTMLLPPAGILLGGVAGGSYPHQFEVKKDSTSIQTLKTKLKKYEWYQGNEDTLNIK